MIVNVVLLIASLIATFIQAINGSICHTIFTALVTHMFFEMFLVEYRKEKE